MASDDLGRKIAILRSAAQSSEARPASDFLLGVALEKQGRIADARAAYEAAAGRGQNTPPGVSAGFRLQILGTGSSPDLMKKIAAASEAAGWFLVNDRWTWSTTRAAALAWLSANKPAGTGREEVARALNEILAMQPDAMKTFDPLAAALGRADDPKAYRLLAGAASERTGDTAAALRAYDAAVREAPDTPYAVSAGFRARILRLESQPPEVLLEAVRAAAAEPSAEGWFLGGTTWMWSSRRDAALRMLPEVQALVARESLSAALDRINALEPDQARRTAAELAGEGAERLAPDPNRRALMRAAALERAGDTAGAIAAYRAAGDQAQGTAYAVSAVFRLRLLGIPQRTSKALIAFYNAVRKEPEAQGWFLAGKNWEWTTTRKAASYGLIDARSDRLSFMLLNFLRSKSVFPREYTYLFVFLVLAFGVKLIELPLTVRGAHTAIKVANLKPKIDMLRQIYKDNPVVMNQQVMQLYREHGVNVWGGCMVALVDLIFVIWAFVALRDYAPQMVLDGARFMTLADITRFNLGIVAFWGACMFLFPADPSKQLNAAQRLLGGILFCAIFGVIGWYWSWPAYVFLFWAILGFVGFLSRMAITVFRRC